MSRPFRTCLFLIIFVYSHYVAFAKFFFTRQGRRRTHRTSRVPIRSRRHGTAPAQCPSVGYRPFARHRKFRYLMNDGTCGVFLAPRRLAKIANVRLICETRPNMRVNLRSSQTWGCHCLALTLLSWPIACCSARVSGIDDGQSWSRRAREAWASA